MKKGLIAGGVLLACVLLLSGIAVADVSTSGSVEFQVNGDPAGLFGGAVASSLSYSLAAEVDSWTAGLTGTVADEGGVLALSGGYIQYTMEMATIKMVPMGVSYGIYDLGGDIGENPGVSLTATLDPVSLSTVVNNAGDLDWSWGLGFEYATDLVTAGLKYNSAEALGVQVVGTMDPITITAQYANKEDKTGYLAKGVYALTTGSVSVCYQKSLDDRTITAAVDDVAEWVDHVWTTTPGSDAVTGDPFTRITAALTGFPVTGTTTFKLEVISQDIADVDYIEGLTFIGETATTLAENVTLTLNLKSADVLTYFGKIGVSF